MRPFAVGAIGKPHVVTLEAVAGSHVYGPITGTWPCATATSMSFTAQLRQLLFFGQNKKSG
jgi:hypothetical protein